MLGQCRDSTSAVSIHALRSVEGPCPTPTPRVLVCFPSCLGQQLLRHRSPGWDGGEQAARRTAWGSERTRPVPLAAAVTMDNEHREVKGVLVTGRAFQGLRVLSPAP